MQAQATFQHEEGHNLCRQSLDRKPLWQGHPCHLSKPRTPAAPHGTTSSATSKFAFEEGHGRGKKTFKPHTGRLGPTALLLPDYMHFSDHSSVPGFSARPRSRHELGKSWAPFLCPVLALNATYKGHTCTKSRGWSTCGPANCPDCSTASVHVSTCTYPSPPGEGEPTKKCREEGRKQDQLPQHLAPTLPSASPDCRKDAEPSAPPRL